jgi:peptide deformylase
MAERPILLLGNPLLRQKCQPVEQEHLPEVRTVVQDLHDTIMDFRRKYNAGRAIAAPQIGYMRRLVYMHIDEPVTFINPILTPACEDTMELWDDCMSFPELLVRVERFKKCRISYRDLEWNEHTQVLENDLSELLQHECDHLDGILAVDRAKGHDAFALRSQRHFLE